MKFDSLLCSTLILSALFGGCVTALAFGGVPPPGPFPDLPGVSKGKIEIYWLAPGVRASEGLGGKTITWFAEDGHIKRQTAVNSVEPGFVEIGGKRETVQGVNEDWKITLPPEPPPIQSGYSMSGYITSTTDSRVFVHQFHPKPGWIAVDVYIHGKLANTVGPFMDYQGRNVELNEDGSTALLVWKDESHTMAQIVTTDTNGVVSFRVDCGQTVDSPIAAPDGTGALLHPNTGGNDENTFMWFTQEGKVHSLAVNPNPACLGWVPKTCQSLFSTSMGFEYRYRLIDWSTGKSLWDIPCPGNVKAHVLSLGFTPKLIIFAVAEPYKPGPWGGAEWTLGNSGTEWIRAFYAVNVQDGSLAARWQAHYPQRLAGEDRDHFFALGNKLFYVTAGEVVELNPQDILSKKNDWQ
jgi:hypothetical protein